MKIYIEWYIFYIDTETALFTTELYLTKIKLHKRWSNVIVWRQCDVVMGITGGVVWVESNDGSVDIMVNRHHRGEKTDTPIETEFFLPPSAR